jgi:hypothetical protein
MVSDLIRSYGQRRAILPRSRQRPVAVTDGSLTENPNEIGVRLWTESQRRKEEGVRHGSLHSVSERFEGARLEIDSGRAC